MVSLVLSDEMTTEWCWEFIELWLYLSKYNVVIVGDGESNL